MHYIVIHAMGLNIIINAKGITLKYAPMVLYEVTDEFCGEPNA